MSLAAPGKRLHHVSVVHALLNGTPQIYKVEICPHELSFPEYLGFFAQIDPGEVCYDELRSPQGCTLQVHFPEVCAHQVPLLHIRSMQQDTMRDRIPEISTVQTGSAQLCSAHIGPVERSLVEVRSASESVACLRSAPHNVAFERIAPFRFASRDQHCSSLPPADLFARELPSELDPWKFA